MLDPACGSGNFLYVSLQLLLDLEKEVITFASQLDWKLPSRVSVHQLKAIELNAYAFELAQVAVQIGYLKWRRDNGFDNDKDPVLQVLSGFENKDALMKEIFRTAPKDLREAQAEEHEVIVPLGAEQMEIATAASQRELSEPLKAKSSRGSEFVRVYHERGWPACDVIVGNPPFLGDKLMRTEMGSDYVDELRRIYGDRIPGQSDLCCYWFEKSRALIEDQNCRRAGLLATQAIRGGANRKVIERIKDSGDIFFAISDRGWILDGANVHVSLMCFDDGSEISRILNGESVATINANLTSETDVGSALSLRANADLGFIGISMHGPFDLDEDQALKLCQVGGNPTSFENSDVLRRILNAYEITKRAEPRWVVAFPPGAPIETSALYEAAFRFIEREVRPVRLKNHRKVYRERWWIHGESRPAMLNALQGLPRFLATPRVSKHRVFVWVSPEYLPSDATVAFAREDDYFFGGLHSRFHEVWARAQGTQLRERESGFRYTPTTCFETFPFPRPTREQEEAVGAAAKELNELRENWLNPPEWTTTRVLEFPGSVDGPWARFIDGGMASVPSFEPGRDRARPSIGLVRYPRIEARDEDCAAKLKKRTLTKLYNERPAWLAHAHAKLDAAVAAAYGWPAEISDDEILARLLELNGARAAEEKATPKSAAPARTSRAKTDEELV